jgi:hypothetical protein
VEQLGVGSRPEGVETLTELTLELLESTRSGASTLVRARPSTRFEQCYPEHLGVHARTA